MNVLPIPSRSEATELLDVPEFVRADLKANLRDIRLLNRWFGGAAAAGKIVWPLLQAPGRFTVLDVATGSADLPLFLLQKARRAGIAVDVTGIDVSREVLDTALDVVGENPITLVRSDARALPFASASFDVVTCFLALHHFSPTDAETVLSEMWRVARRTVAVIDLTRSYPAFAGTWALTRLLRMNRVTQHDGPLSVLRAYTPVELHRMAVAAGLCGIAQHSLPLFRQALVANHFGSRHA